MDNGLDQPWQFDVVSEGKPASRENVDEERRVNCTQQLADSLFDQLLEPYSSNLYTCDTETNGDPAAVEDILWDEHLPPTKDPSDPPRVGTITTVNKGTPTPQPTLFSTAKQKSSSASGNGWKVSAPLLKRPRLRAPKGDPTKRHKCPVAGCTYSANGTGHLYRHMLTHNGRKDHKVSASISLSTGSLHDFAAETHLPVLFCV